eukprot:TRINITY_DN628_c0_g1_i3.p1 TRINITY_DN628_c0_g1~~TRINITY_DN628_c0_g1_i3.p1  ORF type:complete len:642 (+),score=170.30 TRINITY_DN628_c0_g1_i3:138-1928(+)
MLRESDEALFTDEPREYIRMDLEGSDSNTRRRAALELVKAMRKNYESQVTKIFESDIGQLISEYTANPTAKWKSKDVAIYLIAALAVKGGGTVARGLAKTNEMVPIVGVYKAHIVPDITSMATHPIVRSDCVRFIHMFRAQLMLGPEDSRQLFGVLAQALGDPNVVVQTYAAAALERLLAIRDCGVPRYPKELVREFAGSIIANLIKAMQGRTETAKENEYFMQALMRTIVVLREHVVPHSGACVQFLIPTLSAVCENARNPLFNHYLWEALSALIRTLITTHPEYVPTIEQVVMPIMQTILQKDITGGSRVHAVRAAAGVAADRAVAADECVTADAAAVAAAARPLEALWQHPRPRCPHLLLPQEGATEDRAGQPGGDDTGHLQDATQGRHRHGRLHPPRRCLLQHRPSKAYKVSKAAGLSLCLFIARHGVAPLAAAVEAIQPGLTVQVVDGLVVGNMGKARSRQERKLCAVAAARLVAEWAPLASPTCAPLLEKLLVAAHKVITDPQTEASTDTGTVEDNTGLIEISGVGTAFHRLTFAARQDTDAVKDITDPKRHLATAVATFFTTNPTLKQRLPAKLATDFSAWFAEFGLRC